MLSCLQADCRWSKDRNSRLPVAAVRKSPAATRQRLHWPRPATLADSLRWSILCPGDLPWRWHCARAAARDHRPETPPSAPPQTDAWRRDGPRACAAPACRPRAVARKTKRLPPPARHPWWPRTTAHQRRLATLLAPATPRGAPAHWRAVRRPCERPGRVRGQARPTREPRRGDKSCLPPWLATTTARPG